MLDEQHDFTAHLSFVCPHGTEFPSWEEHLLSEPLDPDSLDAPLCRVML